MKHIAITLTLLVAVASAIVATVATGSIHAAGVLVLLGVLSAIWAWRQSDRVIVRGVWSAVREMMDWVEARGRKVQR